jgi:4-hydroxy-L-threonine phosphate dehydrogenase PdxA
MMQDIMKPTAVTMGCPVGIGPEIILRFFEDLESGSASPPVVLGDLAVLARTADLLQVQVKPIPWRPGEAIRPGTAPVLELSQLAAKELRWGQPNRETSLAMHADDTMSPSECLARTSRSIRGRM